MRTKRAGFTLVELMIYSLLFMGIIGSIINAAFTLAVQSQETVSEEYLIDETNLLYERVMRDFGNGSVINTGASTLDVDLSTITFTTEIGGVSETLSYFVSNGSMQKSTNGGAAVAMNSDELTVQRFMVTRLNPSNTVPLLQVTLETENNYGQTYSLTSSINFLNE